MTSKRRLGRLNPVTSWTGSLQVELLCDVALDARRGRRRQGHARRVAHRVPRRRQRQVVRAEVVAPLAHAVGLVDGQERRRRLRAQRALERGHAEPLGRGVDQRQVAPTQAVEDLALLTGRLGRVDVGGRDAARRQRVDLVLHQRDQRRHHDGHAARLQAARPAGKSGSCRRRSASRSARPACRGRGAGRTSWPGLSPSNPK